MGLFVKNIDIYYNSLLFLNKLIISINLINRYTLIKEVILI